MTLITKEEAFEKFRLYKTKIENFLEKKITVLRNGQRREYISTKFSQFCEDCGIRHSVSVSKAPQQNGLDKRKNRTFVEKVNCIFVSPGLPLNLWWEDLYSACYILNRIPQKNSNKTPMSCGKGDHQISTILENGDVWPMLQNLWPVRCAFVAYGVNSKAYKFLLSEPKNLLSHKASHVYG